MSYQVLARKYRPQRFSEVIGQEHVTRTLKNAIDQQRIAHGYIFSGHRGIGKTTIARILAMALNCRSTDQPNPEPCGVCESCVEVRAGSSVDVIEIDAATNRGIDEIRELRDAARYRPARDRFKIYILDEAHQITDAAFNALLKTLEEPPPHIIFMMATTQAEDIPQTIRSRCQHFSFHAVKFDEIVNQLGAIAAKENIQTDSEALAVLAEAGDGSMRDALSIMDQAIACCGTKLSGELVRGLVGNVGSEVFEDIMGTVARGSSEEALRTLDRLMTEGHNPAHFARQLVRFLRNAVVAKVAGDDSSLLQISSDERARVGRVATQFSEEELARFLQIMLRTQTLFRTIARRGNRHHGNRSTSNRTHLQLAKVRQSVQVPSDVLMIQADNSALGREVSGSTLANLPLVTRNYTQVAILSPGVVAGVFNAGELGTGGMPLSQISGSSDGIYVHGGRSYDNNYQLDGISVNDVQGSGSSSGGLPIPNPDTIYEFKVQTGLYDASYGRYGGANVSVITKTGGNAFHGAFFEYFRNDTLNANDFFLNSASQPRPALKQNQFGATLGGPILKDKLFFFASYQGTRQVNGLAAGQARIACTASVSMPPLTNDRSPAALGKLFGGMSGALGGTAVNPDGSNINPVALALLNLKLPNGSFLIPNATDCRFERTLCR